MSIKISETIKRLRKERGITQERLAEYLNISYQAVSKWENGTAYPDITMLPSLASFFGVTVDYLLGADEQIHLYDFEDIPSLTPSLAKEVLGRFEQLDIVKASMAVSPATAAFLHGLFPDIDFTAVRTRIDRIPIQEVTDIHQRMLDSLRKTISG